MFIFATKIIMYGLFAIEETKSLPKTDSTTSTNYNVTDK